MQTQNFQVLSNPGIGLVEAVGRRIYFTAGSLWYVKEKAETICGHVKRRRRNIRVIGGL